MYRGVNTAPMMASDGIEILYVPEGQVLQMYAWHSGRQGAIQPVELSLKDFLFSLGINQAEFQKAIEGNRPAFAVVDQQVERRAASDTAPRPAGVPSAAPSPVKQS